MDVIGRERSPRWFDGSVFFSPDGKRVIVPHEAPPDPRGGRRGLQVWIGRVSDGAHERTVLVPPERSGTGSLPYLLGVGLDGRLLVGAGGSAVVNGELRIGGEVQVWDPDTGEMVHRLGPHDGRIAWANVTPDRSRLFALVDGETSGRLHVWDLRAPGTGSGRELLILPVKLGEPEPRADSRRREVRFDGWRVVVPGPDGTQVLDGSPLRP